jgi:hypothetical protein
MAVVELKKNMIFDDIPKEKRVKKFNVKYDNDKIEALKIRILECREYLNELYKQNK